MPDRWESLPVVVKGGIDLSVDTLTLGTAKPGAATILQNYEPSIAGGYQRILGYAKWDTTTVPGDTDSPILGVCAALGGVFASRHTVTGPDNPIYFSSGSGWTKISSTTRGGTPIRVRISDYAMTAQSIYITDGINPAAKWDGTTYTTINGTGAPTAPKYFEAMASFVALAQGTDLFCSAANSDIDFNGADGAAEFNIGDTITGLRRFRDTLYIFCANSIWELTGESPADWALDTVTKAIGCVSGDTILEVGGDLIYLTPDGFRSLAATYRIDDLQLGLLSHTISPLLLSNDFMSGRSVDSFSALQIRSKNQYRAWVYDDTIPKTTAFGVCGHRIDDPINVTYEWSTLSGIQPYSAHSAIVNQQEIAVIGDPLNGFVYRLESANDFDGVPVSYIYRSPDLTFNDASLRKVMQKLTLYTQVQGDFNISVNVQLDVQDSGTFQPPAIGLSQTGALPLYGSAIYGTSVYSVLATPVFKFPIVGSGFLIAFQYSGTDSNAPHRIDSFQIEYGQKARR